MKRSLRHPFRNPNHFLRSERTRSSTRKPPRQPKLHQNRFSMGSVFETADSSESRPVLRVRVVGLVVVGMFAVLGLRLWTIQVLQAPSAVQAVTANQIRAVAIDPTRGLILDRDGNPLVNNVVTEQITLSRITAQLNPGVVGRLAAAIGQTPAQVQASLDDPKYSPYEPVPVLSDAPLSTVLYIQEHADEFPGVSTVETTQRNYPQTDPPGPFPGGYPAAQTLGYVGAVSSNQLTSLAGKGYQPGDQIGESGLEEQYEPYLRGTPGQQQLEVDSKGQVAGVLKTTPATRGQSGHQHRHQLQQLSDNALASQIAYVRAGPRIRSGQAPAGAQRGRAGHGPAERRRAGRLVVPVLQPGRVGGGHLQRQLRGHRGVGGPEQLRDPGCVPAGVHVQAHHRHLGPADRPDHAVVDLRRHRQLYGEELHRS